METSLHKLNTGLFVESDKSRILLDNIGALLKTKHKVRAESGPVQADGKCEIVLHSLHKTGCEFASAKAVLEQYFAMIKECRPNFVMEKKPEMIDLDEEADSSVICVGDVEEDVQEISVIDLDCTEETVDVENTAKSEEAEDKSDADEEVVCLEDDEEPPTTSLKASTSEISPLDKNKPNDTHSSSPNDSSINLDSSTSDQTNPLLVSNPGSNLIDRSVLKESNHQTQMSKLSDDAQNIEIVEIPDDDDDLETNSSNKTGSSSPKVIKETPKTTLSKIDSSNSNEISKSVEVLANKSKFVKEAISSILNTQSTPEPLLSKKRLFPKKRKKQGTVNILEIPESSTSTSSAKKSKLSYKKPAHLVKPLVQKVTEGQSTVVSSDAQYNIYNPNAGSEEKKTGLRPIVIDGNNVGVSHGKGNFSLKGIQICVNYFEMKGHRQIKVFLPQYRKHRDNHDLLHKMERQGTLVITPSRKVDGKIIASYDDRYIVQYAAASGGVIISTDNYRDLMNEDPTWTDTIKNRLLMFTWADDMLMFPQDPLGRHGPSLRDFLKFPD